MSDALNETPPDPARGDSPSPSPANCVEMDVDGKSLTFSRGEAVTGKTFYFIVVISIIIIIAGAAWTVADYLMPTGKLDQFLALPMGAKLAILGAALFVLFLLIVGFYMLYKRGTHAITKALFSAKKIYREMKTSTLAKIVTGGIMISLFLVMGGIVEFLIELATASGAEATMLGAFLLDMTGGETVLAIGIIVLIFSLMVIGFGWLWSAGNIFFARKFFGSKIKAE